MSQIMATSPRILRTHSKKWAGETLEAPQSPSSSQEPLHSRRWKRRYDRAQRQNRKHEVSTSKERVTNGRNAEWNSGETIENTTEYVVRNMTGSDNDQIE